MKCWLCERGTNLDDGGLQPGEIHMDSEGDPICIYCETQIEGMAQMMSTPGLPLLFSKLAELPHVDGVRIAIYSAPEESA